MGDEAVIADRFTADIERHEVGPLCCCITPPIYCYIMYYSMCLLQHTRMRKGTKCGEYFVMDMYK
jgi:hypothetical protein